MDKSCHFCKENIKYIDYKNTELLRQFLTGQAKIMPPRRSGVCLKHQRALAQAIKRARFMALMPFTTR
ncbi:30S ribosomal protein S18 [Patescibacteria group bacterium]|nr:30S ribosomal protein S18 [Patescibacteria group bacterium]